MLYSCVHLWEEQNLSEILDSLTSPDRIRLLNELAISKQVLLKEADPSLTGRTDRNKNLKSEILF